jgi:hypothetical protein
MGDKTAKDMIGIALLRFVWPAVLLLTGCQTIQYESRLMKSAPQAEQATYNMTAAQLRLQLDDLAGVFTGTIEQAADRVIAESADRQVERHALLWKINAIPMAYRALFQPDPAVALIDTWAFSLQMVVYFEKGHGRDDFDQWHAIALEASRQLETALKEAARRTRTDQNVQPIEAKILIWVEDHPIQPDFIYRDTAIPVLSSQSGQRQLGAVQTVGKLALSVEDISFRLFLHMDLLTKQARWQAEYVMADTDKDAGIQSALRSLDDMVAAVNRITPLVESAPDLIAGEKESVLGALRQERVATLASIEQQRLDTLAYLTRERMAAIDDLKSLQRAITDMLQSEREVVLTSIDSQRKALFFDMESAGNRIVDNALQQSRQMIDHFFIRALQLLTGVLMLGGVVAVVIFISKKVKGGANHELQG